MPSCTGINGRNHSQKWTLLRAKDREWMERKKAQEAFGTAFEQLLQAVLVQTDMTAAQSGSS